MRKRILFFAESVTTAQVTRLVTLARCLDSSRYEVHFASAEFAPMAFEGTSFVRHRVASVDPEAAARALSAGRRIYDTKTIERYVRDDVSVLERVAPALVVGDFRLSLSISAPLTGVPHAALINAYWDPARLARHLPVPDHPIVRLLGERLTAQYFPQAAPRAFAHFAAPVNRVRKKFGQAPLGGLPEVLTSGDHVLYPDPPELVPVPSLPAHHEYLGYVPWSPSSGGEDALTALDGAHPLVYVTLGSSGRLDVLPKLVEGLAALDVTVLLSTAGRAAPPSLPANFQTVPFVRGDLAARRAAFVVSNGGSSTGYQALAEGAPVLGIPSNLDQYLAMTAIEQAGAGILVPARTLTAAHVRESATALLASTHLREKAREVKEQIRRVSHVERFTNFVDRVTGCAAHERRASRAAVGPLAALLLLASALPSTTARAEGAAPVTNEIRFSLSVGSPPGHVVCALFRRARWLEKPVQWQRVVIRKGRADCVFSGVSADTYAISAFHDENDNTKLDTNFIGIPTESWCTSRDAPAFFGPPSFGAAKFLYRGDIMRLQGVLR
ncbi:MAG TPA: DUF2141 domain-containing protein [Polyangiaceae bacterium]|jgi:UDP:flavonoid glycosyltransferase YjiC (YdhE family)/uncharacterized protein (DUF2141 family)|nr:DUF2141 domain-containing protein [Polyangiaceae bacterium]